MNKTFINFLDFFFPRFCLACETKLLYDQEILCPNCIDQIAIPSENMLRNEYLKKFAPTEYLSDFTSAFIFESESNLQKVIHEIKYKSRFAFGKFLGAQIYNNQTDKIVSWNADMIIPVPLYHLKKAERGYNQSYYISKGLSIGLEVKVRTGIIKRNVYTPSQTKLNMKERRQNVESAFSLKNSKVIKDKSIILVDDVITTGSTINECAKLLKEAGAKNVFAASVAIANPLHSIGSA